VGKSVVAAKSIQKILLFAFKVGDSEQLTKEIVRAFEGISHIRNRS
jgi:hypothetical protein